MHFVVYRHLFDLTNEDVERFKTATVVYFQICVYQHFNKSPLKLHDEMKGRDIQTYMLHLKLHNALGTFV